MIARLKGRVVEKTADTVVIDCGGVGYLVHASVNTLAAVPDPGDTVTLHIHTSVREDALDLFGFASHDERQAFRLLLSVKGIGPKLATGILSGVTPSDLGAALAAGDLRRLTKIPGVGKRTAERMVVELKDKFDHIAAAPAPLGSAPLDDLVSALKNLGYTASQAADLADRAVADAPDADLAELLRLAMRHIHGGR